MLTSVLAHVPTFPIPEACVATHLVSHLLDMDPVAVQSRVNKPVKTSDPSATIDKSDLIYLCSCGSLQSVAVGATFCHNQDVAQRDREARNANKILNPSCLEKLNRARGTNANLVKNRHRCECRNRKQKNETMPPGSPRRYTSDSPTRSDSVSTFGPAPEKQSFGEARGTDVVGTLLKTYRERTPIRVLGPHSG